MKIIFKCSWTECSQAKNSCDISSYHKLTKTHVWIHIYTCTKKSQWLHLSKCHL